MSGKNYFSYVRVSTQRQGNLGTSLTEQQTAIERYAERYDLAIIKRYEERETAARQGRPVFSEMLKLLKQNRASGIIVHKIDRSARNLKDWADLGLLIDAGLEVHFANESLDLSSRGGRLSADIQAVVAADFIRNLREETKKGIYGRLKQGLYPFPARVGYHNAGKGEAKRVDPPQAPLVRQAYEFYASGNVGLNALVEKMYEAGLRNKSGSKISRNGLVGILKNPFYMGLIRIERTGEFFVGVHTPLISKLLFDRVQDVFAGKRLPKVNKHFFKFRRVIHCALCKNLLIAERQKGYVYYRCQTKQCPQKTMREEIIENEILTLFEKLQLTEEEFALLETEAINYQNEEPQLINTQRKQILLEISNAETRLAKIADAYMDEVFDRETYFTKKNELIVRQKELKEKLTSLTTDNGKQIKQFREFLELLKSVYLSYKSGNEAEKREMVKITFSNCTAKGKSLSIKLKKPFETVLEREQFPSGSPRRATARTSQVMYVKLFNYFKDQTISKNAEKSSYLTP